MVPEDLIRFSLQGEEVVPHYLLERDHPWLRTLLELYHRYEGRTRRELAERMAEPLGGRAPQEKVKVAAHVLDRIWRFESAAEIAPRKARAALFGAAAGAGDRAEALREACAALGVAAPALERSLFADLPDEKIVTPPPVEPSPATLAQRANLALVSGMLRRADCVRIEAEGNVRPIFRLAKLRGLLCALHAEEGKKEQLEISGPFALFRRTLVYGRALATLVPAMAWCGHAVLRASCLLGPNGSSRTLVVRAGDPLFPSAEPKAFDSRLERVFATDFARLAPDWDVVREPRPLRAGGTLVFPDFELVHRLDPRRRWLLEIVGFWTPDYIEKKLAALRDIGASEAPRLILCLDEERNCAADDLPPNAAVVRFRRRVDAADVLRIVEGGGASVTNAEYWATRRG
jgi:predicted nuclease of restriction endonuclease-like RecB superfamily